MHKFHDCHHLVKSTGSIIYTTARSLCVVILILFASQIIATANDRVVKILLDEDKDYGLLQVSTHDDNGFKTSLRVEDCPAINDQAFDGAYRFELELAIVCNALREADLADRLDFLPYPSVKRAIAEVEAGRADMIGSTIFKSQAKGDILRSDPTLRVGEFQVALFTTPNREDVKNIDSVESVRQLRGITVKNWRLDYQALESMGLAGIVTSRKMTQIPQMIAKGRADFTLSYLDRPTTMHMGGPLVRIDGFRVSLRDERVFVVSNQAAEMHQAINRFIRMKRQEPVDKIREAHLLTGFITDKYDDWLNVGQPMQ